MKLLISGIEKSVPDGITVFDLLLREHFKDPQSISVTVNEKVINPNLFARHILHENERVEFIYFIGGG